MLRNKSGKIHVWSAITTLIGIIIILFLLKWIGFDFGHFDELFGSIGPVIRGFLDATHNLASGI